MRVGVVLLDQPPAAGGGFTFEHEIVDSLAALRTESHHEFVLLVKSSKGAGSITRTASGLEVDTLEARFRDRVVEASLRRTQALRMHVHHTSAIDRAAHRHRLDFVWFAGASGHFTNLPYLAVVWDLQHRVTPWFPEMSWGGEWHRREAHGDDFLRRAAAIVTGTSVGRREIEQLVGVPSERILVLPHPTPAFALAADEHVPALPARLGLVRPFVLYPAQLWPHKNHANLVLAMARVIHEHGLDLDLVLPGDDKGNRAHVERMAREAGIADRVHLPGFVDRDELVALYRHARCLAYASWCGPENLPPLEAFALGCPVIASDVPGAREQLGDAAVLVPPGDPDRIAQAIVALERSPRDRERLIERGRARAAKWTGPDYVRGVFRFLDAFEPIARSWSPLEFAAARA